jgi:hypothetical protein
MNLIYVKLIYAYIEFNLCEINLHIRRIIPTHHVLCLKTHDMSHLLNDVVTYYWMHV